MSFAIIVRDKIDEAYTWVFGTLEEANTEAERMSKKYNIDIHVVKIMGTWRRSSIYVQVE